MDFRVIALLVATVAFAMLWVIVRVKGPKTATTNIYSFHIFNVLLWTLGLAMFYRSSDLKVALFWTNVLYLAGSLIAASFLHFSYVFPHYKVDIPFFKQVLIYIPNIILFYFFFFTPFIVKEVVFVNGSKGYIYGPWHILWDLQFDSIFILAFWRFIKAYKNNIGIVKMRLRYILLGTMIALIWAGTADVIMPWFNRFELLWTGPIISLTWLMFVVYAIIKYRLMDIKVAVTRAGIFLIVYTLVLGIPFWIGYQTKSWFITGSFMFVLATLGPFIFSYLRRRTEDILLAEQIRYQKEIKEFSPTLIYIKDLNELTEKVVTKIHKSIKLTFAGIYLRREREYYLAGIKTNDYHKLPSKIDNNSDIIKLLKETTTSVLGEHLPKMEGINIGVGAPLLLNSDLGGFILLGNKQEGIFTDADIDMLSILSSQTSLALAEIYYFNEYQKATAEKHRIEIERSRLESAFQISEAYRHELGNIINVITLAGGSLKSYPKYKPTEKDVEEAAEAIDRNIQRANRIFNAVKLYNDNARSKYKNIMLDKLLDEKIKNYRQTFKEEKIEVKADIGKNIQVLINDNFEYALSYLMEGAVTALNYYKPKERSIYISLRNSDGTAILEIADTGKDATGDEIYQGVGIERGKEGGILYFIARRIISDHMGEFEMESYNGGEGTRFIIKVPLERKE
jgi:K+-sensing histidine kinase KdpD